MSTDDAPRGAAPDPIDRAGLGPPRGLRAVFRGKLAVYRNLLRVRANRSVSPTIAVTRFVDRAPAVVPLLSERYRRWRGAMFERDLRLLNDVLSEGPLAGRYWLWGGLLLGWAREGRLLPHDIGDADFAVSAEDEERLDVAETQLLAAGFRRGFRFHSNAGTCTERVYVRHGFKFEFFRMTPVDDRTHEFHVYGLTGRGPVEAVGHLPRQPLATMDFLGRPWMKPLDHDLALRTSYGDWRTPDPSWDWFDDPSLVSAHSWRPGADGVD
jgi:hypothetical protein